MSGADDLILMEYGRHLIRRAAASGRWHHQPLSDRDVDRGAQAVVSDPYYRSDIGHVALVWASDHGDAVDTAIVREALDRLAEADHTRNDTLAPLPNAYADVLNGNTADTDQWDAEERAAEKEGKQ